MKRNAGSGKAKRNGISLGRILATVMLLVTAAQAAMFCIGFYYSDSINRTIHEQRMELISEQFAQNVTVRLNGVSRLLSFLSSSEVRNYFEDYMNLRDASVAQEGRNRLQEQLSALRLSPDLVRTVYLLGENVNQKAYRETVGGAALEPLSLLRMDTFQKAEKDSPLYLNQYRLMRYDEENIRALCSVNPVRSAEAGAELAQFSRDIDGKLAISNVSGRHYVLVMLVLDDRLFQSAAWNADSQGVFTVLGTKGEVLWSTSARADLLRGVAAGKAAVSSGGGEWVNNGTDIRPFNLRVVYSERQAARFLPVDLLLLSLVMLLVAFLFSFVYLKTILRPFRSIAGQIAGQPENAGGRIVFRPLSLRLRRRFPILSMRGKITVLFCVILSIFVVGNSFLYLRLMERDVDSWMDDSSERLGGLASVGIDDQVRNFEDLSNQFSVSRQLQDYLIKNSNTFTETENPLETLQSLSDVSYLVLLDSHGTALYSSIYSHNLDIFNISSAYLKDQDTPYWVVGTGGSVNGIPAFLLRKIEEPAESLSSASYLLLAPKESNLSVAETEQMIADFTIADAQGRTLFHRGSLTTLNHESPHLHYQKPVAHTGWTFSVDYEIPDVTAMERSYRQQFFSVIALIFLLAVAAAVRISAVMTRNLHRVCGELQAARTAGSLRRLEYSGHDEIGDIIGSYNRMIQRLQESVRQNMQIMEENARNKIRQNELLALKARTEIHMLQMQINPHFLYNTLNTINVLSGSGNRNVNRIVNALSAMLRYSMVISPDTVPLRDEIAHACNYITIQQIRFGGNFTARFDIPEEVCRCRVPRIILQPLIENAIQHGFEGWKSGGEIEVGARLEAGMIRIRVRDNGVGMDPETLRALRRGISAEPSEDGGPGGIGLRNVCQRIRLRYGERGKIELRSALMEGTEVCLQFPAEDEGAGPEGGTHLPL